MPKYRIADAVIEIQAPTKVIDEAFGSFSCSEGDNTDLLWKVEFMISPEIPENLEWKDFDGFYMSSQEDSTIIRYQLERGFQIHYIVYTNHYHEARFYCTTVDVDCMSKEESDEFAQYLFFFFREAFFLGILQMDGISIHSASIIYRNQGIVFSAPSQTGKTTHTNLWRKRYDTPILDGDVTVCRYMDHKIYIYGLPWCGSSGKFRNQRVPLRAVVFLKQGSKNRIVRLGEYEIFQNLFARSFTPLWNIKLTTKRIELTQKIMKYLTYAYSLECLPDDTAVDAIKETLDHDWSIAD